MRGPGSIPTRDNIFFCNPNLHNIARSDRTRFKTKNPNVAVDLFSLNFLTIIVSDLYDNLPGK